MNAPFLSPSQRTAQFRKEFAALTPAEAMDALAWLLDPAQGDPAPDLPDELTDALLPVYKAYSNAYDAIEWAIGEGAARCLAEDEADYRYQAYRDRQLDGQIDRELRA
jgi:hypothetical protein